MTDAANADPMAIRETLRAQGWLVAVNNDYHLGGRFHTYYQMIHPKLGLAAKGEGETHLEALIEAQEQAVKRMADADMAGVAKGLILAAEWHENQSKSWDKEAENHHRVYEETRAEGLAVAESWLDKWTHAQAYAANHKDWADNFRRMAAQVAMQGGASA
jgi:hypothetical protein